jgi:hypothetical protein
MEVCYWALLFMPLVIFHHLLNVFVQLANKRGLKKLSKWCDEWRGWEKDAHQHPSVIIGAKQDVEVGNRNTYKLTN